MKQLNIRDISKDMTSKDVSKVMATGSSNDQNSLLATLDKLRITSGISNLELKSQQGSDPILFSFEFDWESSRRLDFNSIMRNKREKIFDDHCCPCSSDNRCRKFISVAAVG